MIFTLGKQGVSIPVGVLTAPEISHLKKRLTVSSKGFNDRIITSRALHAADGITYLARMRGALELTKLGHTVQCELPEGDAVQLVANIALKPYQQQIYQHLVDTVYTAQLTTQGLSSCTLDMQPGKGKTYIAMALMQRFACKTLFVVPGKDLVKQTQQTLQACFAHATIGVYSSDQRTDGDIVVMTANSASSATEYTFKQRGVKVVMQPREYFARFGCTIYDEIHMYCSRERQNMFTRCSSLYTLGMSGTCHHRVDGMDAIAHHYVGVPVSAAPYIPATNTQWKFEAVCLRYNGPSEYTKSLTSTLGTISHPMMVTQFSGDPHRSQLLVNKIRELAEDGHQVFVMLDRTELVRLAVEYLSTVIDGEVLAAVGMVTGQATEQQRCAARGSRVVVGTYQCLGTGLSWDEFSAVVFWHPRRTKFEQFLNRIFRENGDREKTRQAVYLQDNATSIKTQYTGFRTVCKEERGVVPRVVNHEWSDIQVSDEVKKIAQDFRDKQD